MARRGQSGKATAGILARLACAGVCAAVLLPLGAWAQAATAPVLLDRVVAVVNDEVILASDIENEIHLSSLEPRSTAGAHETRADALGRLISRSLIRQQMREEEGQATLPTAQEVADRLQLMRRELPACVRAKCETDAGWQRFLLGHDLAQDEVEDYVRNRLAILHFIELRFRQGIRISREEIEAYYRDMLAPQYTAGETAPTLDQVSPRIEEILLQQKVNVLFSDWLENLRKQGQIEVLDPKLEAAVGPAAPGAGTQ